MLRHGLRLMRANGYYNNGCWVCHRLGVGGIYVEFVGNNGYRLRVRDLGIDEEVKNTTAMNKRFEHIDEIDIVESERIRRAIQDFGKPQELLLVG